MTRREELKQRKAAGQATIGEWAELEKLDREFNDRFNALVARSLSDLEKQELMIEAQLFRMELMFANDDRKLAEVERITRLWREYQQMLRLDETNT